MISVAEVITDPDMIAPQPFTILRSTGQFVLGGFQTVVTSIQLFGPVHQATDRELKMLPQGDQISSVRSFWSLQPLYETRGYAPVPSVHGEVPQGSSTSYTLSAPPPNEIAAVYVGGALLRQNTDYTISGSTITFTTAPTEPPYATWNITANVATNASDILQYEDQQYRILQVYFDPGGGYYKALGTRMAAA